MVGSALESACNKCHSALHSLVPHINPNAAFYMYSLLDKGRYSVPLLPIVRTHGKQMNRNNSSFGCTISSWFSSFKFIVHDFF